MTIRISLFLAAALLIAGCTSDRPSDDPVDEPGVDEVVAVSYSCESGHTAEATYGDDSATVVYGGETYDLFQTEAANGARYVGGDFVWWTDGTEASVFQLDADGNAGEVLDTCNEAAFDWIEEALEEAEEAVEDAADEVEEAVEEVEEAVEEATEG